MSDTASLQISISVSGARRATDDLDRLNQGAGRADRSAGGMASSMRAAGAAMAGYFSLRAASYLIQQADAFGQLEARVRRFSDSIDESSSNYNALLSISSATGAQMATSVGVFSALSGSLKEMGASTQQILLLTDTLNKLGVVGGSSTDEMNNSLRQFSQSMAGGVVRAEEFNSVLENTPEIARALAAGLGLTMGELRQEMLSGKLTADRVLEAILSQTERVNAEFTEMPRTVDQASAALNNNLSAAVANLNKELKVTQGLAYVIDKIAQGVRISAGNFTDQENYNLLLERRKELMLRIKNYGGLEGSQSLDFMRKQLADVNTELGGLQDKFKEGVIGSSGQLSGGVAVVTKQQEELNKLTEEYGHKITAAHMGGREQAVYNAQLKLGAEATDEQRRSVGALAGELYDIESQKRTASDADRERLSQEKQSHNERLRMMREQEAEWRRAQQDRAAQEGKASSFLTGVDRLGGTSDDQADYWLQDQMEQLRIMNETKVQIDREGNEQRLITQAEYEQASAQLTEEWSRKKDGIAQQAAQQRLYWEQYTQQQALALAGNAIGAMRNLATEGSAAWVAMTIAQKGIMAAQAFMSANLAATQALTAMIIPGNPASIPAAISMSQGIRAIGYANAGLIIAQGITEVAGARADGGQVMGGSAYRGGERGMEYFQGNSGKGYFIPPEDGQVVPNHKMSGSGAVSIQQNLTIKVEGDGSQLNADTVRVLAKMVEAKSQEAINNAMRPGGSLNRR